MRKLTRGMEIGHYRIFWTNKDWRSKPHPFWFFRNYRGCETWTFQSMRFEIWKRSY